MSEFTERVRRETQERITALNAAIEELEAERLQLDGIVTAIDAHEPKIERRESEDRAFVADTLAQQAITQPTITPDLLAKACAFVDQGQVFTLNHLGLAIGAGVFLSEQIVDTLVAEGVIVDVSLAFDPPDPRHWVKVGADEGAEQAARDAAERPPVAPVDPDHGPGVRVSVTGEDGKRIGEWTTYEDGTHEPHPAVEATTDASLADLPNSELELGVDEEAPPQQKSDSGDEDEEEGESPAVAAEDPDLLDDEPEPEPPDEPDEPRPERESNGRRPGVRLVTFEQARDFVRTLKGQFSSRALVEHFEIEGTTARTLLKELMDNDPPILVRHGTTGRSVRYEYIKPDPRSGPRVHPRHDGPRQFSQRGKGNTVPHTGRAKGRSGKPGRDKKMAELGFKVKRGSSGGRRV